MAETHGNCVQAHHPPAPHRHLRPNERLGSMTPKDGMKLAAAVIGTSLTGRPPVHVSRKILPMRAGLVNAGTLLYTTRLVYDAQQRCVEEVKLLSGRQPPGASR